MVQGTSSGAGKSVMVAALCRIFTRMGLRTSPFKAQNMALNSYVTASGGEIGRSTAVQAMAAEAEPVEAMNPILLKPKGDTLSQLIVMGKPVSDVSATDYFEARASLMRKKMNAVRKAWKQIGSSFDLVVIEGAGSPAEINLRRQDVVNMRMAKLAEAPVILVTDIDRGGAFASLVGTYTLLKPSERKRLGAFLLNKFRGDPSLLNSAMDETTRRTKAPFLGVVPYIRNINIQEEDAVPERIQGSANPDIRIGIVYMPHISNFTDFDPLAWEPGVQLIYVSQPHEISGLDAVIVPGTKNTMDDTARLHETGMADVIVTAAGKGAPVVGACGGYQIIGRTLEDENLSEGGRKSVPGLDLIPVVTTFGKTKVLRQDTLTPAGAEPFLSATDLKLAGYEIHHGRTKRLKGARPAFLYSDGEPEGCVNENGLIFGTYLHGLFDNDGFRRHLVNAIRKLKNLPELDEPIIRADDIRRNAFDSLADKVLESIDEALLRKLARLEAAAS